MALLPHHIGYMSVVGPVVAWDGTNEVELIGWLNDEVAKLPPVTPGYEYEYSFDGFDTGMLKIEVARGGSFYSTAYVPAGNLLGIYRSNPTGALYSFSTANGSFFPVHMPTNPTSGPYI